MQSILTGVAAMVKRQSVILLAWYSRYGPWNPAVLPYLTATAGFVPEG
jgi:hypothetical protein